MINDIDKDDRKLIIMVRYFNNNMMFTVKVENAVAVAEDMVNEVGDANIVRRGIVMKFVSLTTGKLKYLCRRSEIV